MFGSVAAEKWLKETVAGVTAVTALVGDIDHVVVGDVVPEDVSLPAVLITGTFASDSSPVGYRAKVTAETLRFQVAVVAEGESYSPIIPAAVAIHGRIHRTANEQVEHPDLEGTYFIGCQRVGELPMRRITGQGTSGDGSHFVQLGGEYELEVTQGG